MGSRFPSFQALAGSLYCCGLEVRRSALEDRVTEQSCSLYNSQEAEGKRRGGRQGERERRERGRERVHAEAASSSCLYSIWMPSLMYAVYLRSRLTLFVAVLNDNSPENALTNASRSVLYQPPRHLQSNQTVVSMKHCQQLGMMGYTYKLNIQQEASSRPAWTTQQD